MIRYYHNIANKNDRRLWVTALPTPIWEQFRRGLRKALVEPKQIRRAEAQKKKWSETINVEVGKGSNKEQIFILSSIKS